MGKQLNSESLRNRLKLRSFASEQKLLSSHSTAAEFFKEVNLRPGKIREHATRLLTSGVLAGSLFLSVPNLLPPPPATPTDRAVSLALPIQLNQQIKSVLKSVLPEQIQPLNPDQETKISQILEQTYGLKATASLENNKLNTDYGRMGAEQHLPRYPGDTAVAHGELIEKGITPGLGGWGYVADFETEKYYVAVQTLYLPDWKQRTQYYVDWYKFRRVVVVNPANGKVIVAAVADAGPANWTGKHFGGSPEVMAYLGINYGMQNHPVVLFFLDDPEKKIPLGPIEYNIKTGNPVLANKA